MKALLSMIFAGISVFTISAQSVTKEVTDGIRYCESTYPYEGGMLIANFGAEQLNPLNSEGKGYIVWHKDGKNQVLIAADGHLSAPKGMWVHEGFLYVCDVNKVMVYNLKDKSAEPYTIQLPEGHLFANDVVVDGNYLYISVTNTDTIFRVDITRPSEPGTPEVWLSVPGPNGLLLYKGALYVASYPADGNTTDRNVVYRVADMKNPLPEKWVETPGQYDGLALASDGKAIYLTNWAPAQICRVDLATREMKALDVDLAQPLVGPADISVMDGCIYIPDLPNSRVVVVKETE